MEKVIKYLLKKKWMIIFLKIVISLYIMVILWFEFLIFDICLYEKLEFVYFEFSSRNFVFGFYCCIFI